MYEKDRDDDAIDLTAIQYRPSENLSKKDVKEREKQEKIQAKYDAQLEKQIKKKPRAGKATPQELSEEEATTRRKMITLLSFYVLEFPEKLKMYKKINLEKKTIDELKNLHREMNITLSNKSNTKMGMNLVCGALQAMELLTVNLTPLNCTGLTQAVISDPETVDLIKQVSLKHCGLFELEPEQRLMGNILMTSVKLHMINSLPIGQISRPVQINEEVLKDINKQYNDL